MATPGVIPTDANRDTVVRLHRQTRENRHLWYQLTVLQQPERARACGAGTKANSDRRPVDPPPVVELRIKEGNSFEEGKEITFDYNASFFLYASLEQYRKIAPGRIQTQPNPPILTGVPASGMAYLDRPAAAGYFIFPDLSVRHEGQYRLSFSLFETTKEEKDFDLEPAENNLQNGVDWRMEIKTAAFDVYSAKKFPGLMESTPLSKEVADQGCRVRIRRDVRMRKRPEGKANNDHDRREEDFSRRRTVTPASEDPHAAAARARSLSNSSEHRVPYLGEPQSRPDAYHPPPPPPPPSHPGYDSGSRHLAFGTEHGVSQYAAPRQYSHQPLAPVSPGGPYTPSSQYAKPDPQPYAYPPSRSIPQPSPSPALRHEGHDRRRSGPYASPSPTIYSPAETHIRREAHHSYPNTPVVAQPPARLPALSQIQRPQSPVSSQYRDYRGYRSYNNLAPIEPQTEPLPEPVPITTGDKRKRDDVFPQLLRPLHNGQRQLDIHDDRSRRGFSPEPGVGSFERADGTIQNVTWPKYSWDP